MKIHNCHKCEWWQPLKMLDNGSLIYGCAHTMKRHHWRIDCPKYIKTIRGKKE